MKILVTGGAGFIGSHIVEEYQERASEIHVLDNLRSGHLHNLAGLRHTFFRGSITDLDLVRRAMEGVEHVFHLAALVSVPESMQKIRECVEINVNGLLHVLEAACEAGVKKVVFASSAAVYGDNPEVPKRETMCPEPRSPYAITKWDGEQYLDLYHRDKQLETVALRFFNVFGPRQDPGSAYAAAVPIFMEKALRGEALTIDGDGDQTRDFIYVKDIAGALRFAAETPGLTGVFNAGYGAQTSINELAKEIVRAAGSESPLEHARPRSGDIRHSCANVDKLRAAGWRPRHELGPSLTATLAYFRAGMG